MYHFATLDPRDPSKVPAAGTANDAVFAAATGGVYGVEVTVPALAARCELGNLDPQHSGGQNVAACVAALDCELPPNGATLVTVRPDADALVAMAVLDRRLRGGYIREDRVRLVGDADSAPAGPWIRNYQPPREFAEVNAAAMNHRETMEQRVSRVDGWAGGGNGLLPALAEPDESEVDDRLSPCGRYAVVRADGSAGRGAMGVGYRLAPVAVAVNEAFSLRGESPHRKYTVARWNATHVPMDWAGMLAELRELEPGWGGSSSICGSPQGVGSTLTLDQVTAIVERHL